MSADFSVPVAWTELARRTFRETLEDGCPGLAAQLAFYFFLAVFPALLVMVSLLSYAPVDSSISAMTDRLDPLLPPKAVALVQRHLEQLMEGGHASLLTLGVLGAIWSSSSAMNAIIVTLNRAYDIHDRRPWWRKRLLAIGLTVGLALFVTVAMVLVVGGRGLGGWAAGSLGVGPVFGLVWTVLHWPVAIAFVVLAVNLVYHFAPNTHLEWAWITPGSLLATGMWLAISYGFREYVTNFANFNIVYGAIGSVIVLLLWFYFSGLALLIGAELNAEIAKAAARSGSLLVKQAPEGRQLVDVIARGAEDHEHRHRQHRAPDAPDPRP